MSCADARRHLGLISVVAALFGVSCVAAATELSQIVITPNAGQNAAQLQRDRYECHNWVVAQNSVVPTQGVASDQARRDRRAERVGRVVTGAAIGAAAGGVIRGARDYREADDGALAGGVLGAIAGAVIGGRRGRDNADGAFADYYRGLDACMSARGYSLSISE